MIITSEASTRCVSCVLCCVVLCVRDSTLHCCNHNRSLRLPSQTLEGFNTKLSASGLLYRHYGTEIICELYPSLKSDPSKLSMVYKRFYSLFMEAIDAVDNGIEPADSLRYRDYTSISCRVARLNKPWNCESEEPTEDQRFEKASAMCGEAFVESLKHLVEVEMSARDRVEEAVNARGVS